MSVRSQEGLSCYFRGSNKPDQEGKGVVSTWHSAASPRPMAEPLLSFPLKTFIQGLNKILISVVATGFHSGQGTQHRIPAAPLIDAV